MAAPLYADAADYSAAFEGATVSDELLTAASSVVDELLIGTIYSVDDDQYPTDERIRETLKLAALSQARWCDEKGDTTGTGAGSTAAVTSASIGSASFSMDAKAAAEQRHVTASGRPAAPAAISILRVEGLLPVSAIVHG